MTHAARPIIAVLLPAAAALIAIGVAFAATTDPSLANLLGVLDDTDVVVLAPDGTEARRITALPEGTTAFQPIWSPDGKVIAFAENGSSTAGLVTLEVDGAGSGRIDLPAPTFYYFFSPMVPSIVWLRNDAGAGLVLETENADGLDVIDRGAPFYFAWSPNGDEIAAHIGVDRMDRLAAARQATTINENPGRFLAPWWTDRGVFYIRSRATGQELVVNDGDGESIIARVIGPANFAVAGSKLAIQTFGSREGGVAAAFQQVASIGPGNLNVIDLDTLIVDEVVPQNVIAFFWDPTGTRLLLLEVVERESGTFTWTVWSAKGLAPYAEFVIDVSWLRDFLPFFDQYAQSMTLWSPDGTAFAFPGTIGGRSGIWVQELAGGEPTHVSPGTWVAWSPAISGP